MHSGHRDRLRNKVVKYGFDVLEKHEILELYLTNSIPRRNTNDISHNLINQFGSIRNLFTADIENILQIPGVGKNSSVLIKLLNSVYKIYSNQKSPTQGRNFTRELMYKYIINNCNVQENSLFIVQANSCACTLSLDKIDVGNCKDSHKLIKEIITKIVVEEAKNIMLAYHNSSLLGNWSIDIIKLIKELNYYLKLMDTRLLDCVLMEQDGCKSVITGNKIRHC